MPARRVPSGFKTFDSAAELFARPGGLVPAQLGAVRNKSNKLARKRIENGIKF